MAVTEISLGWGAVCGAKSEAVKVSHSMRPPVCSGAFSVTRPSVTVAAAEKLYSSRSGTHA